MGGEYHIYFVLSLLQILDFLLCQLKFKFFYPAFNAPMI